MAAATAALMRRRETLPGFEAGSRTRVPVAALRPSTPDRFAVDVDLPAEDFAWVAMKII